MLRDAWFGGLGRWQCFGFERGSDLRLFGGLKLELLKGDGVLAKALTHAKQTGVGRWILDAQRLDAVAVEAGDGMIKLSAAEMEDCLMKLAGIGGFEQLEDSFVASAEVGGDFLMADPVLVTAIVPVGEVIDREIMDAVGPAMAMLFELMNDAGVLGTVIDHVVDEFPEVFREASDFTSSTIHWTECWLLVVRC